jgi:hypothetical protein
MALFVCDHIPLKVTVLPILPGVHDQLELCFGRSGKMVHCTWPEIVTKYLVNLLPIACWYSFFHDGVGCVVAADVNQQLKDLVSIPVIGIFSVWGTSDQFTSI